MKTAPHRLAGIFLRAWLLTALFFSGCVGKDVIERAADVDRIIDLVHIHIHMGVPIDTTRVAFGP